MTVAWDRLKRVTEEAFQSPQVGDRFQEMYSFWVRVLYVDDVSVLVEETPGGRRVWQRSEYATKAYRYETAAHLGHWVTISDRAGEQVPYEVEAKPLPLLVRGPQLHPEALLGGGHATGPFTRSTYTRRATAVLTAAPEHKEDNGG